MSGPSMTGSSARRARILIILAAILACAAPAAAQKEAGFRSAGGWLYSYEVAPPELETGGTALLILKIEGMSASSLRVDSMRLSQGLELETQAVRPYVMEGNVRGAELRLGFILREAGTQRIEWLSVAADEGDLSIGPIPMVVKDSGGAAPRPVLWAWNAPSSAYRYQAFEAGLERADGFAAAKDLTAAFAPPADATTESSGYLRWTVVALEEGRLSLPDATLEPPRGSSARKGEAEAVQVAIKALPKAVASSRAIGAFSLALTGPEPSRPVAGSPADFALRLEGSGNFPCLILPDPELLLDDAPLGKSAWSSRRTDDVRPSSSGYSGSAVLRVSVTAPRPGRLTVRFPPMPTLGLDGKVRELEVRPIEVDVAASGAAPAAAPPARQASQRPAAPPKASSQPAAREAQPLPKGDERGAALASLYGTMRRALPFERAYREAEDAARAIAAELARESARPSGQGQSRAGGAVEPELDPLPPPRLFIAIAAVLLAAALAAFVASRKRGNPPRRRRIPVAAVVLAAVALAAGGLALAAALERRDAYAVVWTEGVSVIPSPLAELEVSVPLGSTAKVRLEALGFTGLVFADGVEAWAPSDRVFEY